MTDSTTYFKNIWPPSTIYGTINGCSHRGESKQAVVLPYFVNKFFGARRAIEMEKTLKKLGRPPERCNKDFPTLAAVIIDNTPLGDCRSRLHPLLIPETRLTSTTLVGWPSIKRPVPVASYKFHWIQIEAIKNTIAGKRNNTNHRSLFLPFKISVSSNVKPTHEGSRGEVKGASVRKAYT
jgi:hypothetical protein